jgi:hypothetical protein
MKGSVFVGEVHSTYHKEKGGRIQVKLQVEEKQILVDADYASPIGGPGHGFFAIPTIGTKVLVANGSLPIEGPLPEGGWIWFACVQENDIMESARVSSPRQWDKKPAYESSWGTPDRDKAYGGDEGYPCQYILMTPKGHKLVLSDRVGQAAEKDNTSDDSISIQSSNGKKVVLDETTRANGAGDMILIQDDSKKDSKNRIRIQTGMDDKHSSPIGQDSIEVFANKNVVVHTDAGAINISVGQGSDGPFNDSDLVIDNQGLGNIQVKSHGGNVDVESYGVGKAVTVKAKNSLTQMESSVTVSPESILLYSVAPINISSESMVNIQAPVVNIDQVVTNRPLPKGIV